MHVLTIRITLFGGSKMKCICEKRDATEMHPGKILLIVHKLLIQMWYNARNNR